MSAFPSSHLSLRLAIVVSHPTQYYSPWFQWLHASGGWALRVFYLWDAGVCPRHDPQFGVTFAWDVDLTSGYDHEFVPNVSQKAGTNHFNGLKNPELISRLAAWRPDAILLFGYAYRSHVQVVRWARRMGRPLIFRGDSHFLGRRPPSGLKGLVLRWLFRRFSAVTYVGAANRDYFRAQGVPESHLFFAPHCVDHRRFNPDSARDQEAAAKLRIQLGLTPETKVVLFAGKLIPAKQPHALLDAFLALAPEKACLIFLGEGEERESARSRAASAGALGKSVHFLAFANQSEMPSRYLLADIFTLPSSGHYETWGLGVNEAMHMGVPCLVSDRVGCQRDLVTDGETGWTFPVETPGSLRATLERALADVRLHPVAFRRAVQTRIAGYTYTQATQGLRAALASALSRPTCD